MKKIILFYIIVILFLVSGCSKLKIYTSTPVVQYKSNDYFEASLEPLLKIEEKFFYAFRLVIDNISDRELIIDWSKTRYIYDGKNAGGFAFDGITAENINDPPPDILPAGAPFTKIIWPVQLIGFEKLGTDQYVKVGDSGFTRGIIPPGKNGILLIVKLNGQEKREEITLNIEVTEIKK